VTAVERVGELVLSRRNAARALAAGGLEVGQAHYRFMTVFHTAFLLACAVEVLWGARPFPGGLGWIALVAVLAAQGLRYWAITTLGERWNTRVIVVPGAAPVTAGPYRWVRHPNYVAVIVELLALPLVHGAWITALVATVVNSALLRVRISTEEEALGQRYAQAFATRPRFVPGAAREP
jgi:methyltransferase